MDDDERALATADRLEGSLMEELVRVARRRGAEGADGGFEGHAVAGGRVRLFASSVCAHSLLNRAVGLASWAGVADGVVGDLDRFRAEHARSGLWIDLPALRSARWDEWLARRDAVATGVGRYVLVHRGELAPIARSGHHVSRLAPHEAAGLGALLARGLGLGLACETGPAIAAMSATPGWHVVVARDDDRPVAAATLYVRGDEGLLGPAATAPSARRRGAHLALIATLIRAALDLGVRSLLATVPDAGTGDGAPLVRNLVRCGFRAMATTHGFAIPAQHARRGEEALRSPRQPPERGRDFAHARRVEGDDRPLARDR